MRVLYFFLLNIFVTISIVGQQAEKQLIPGTSVRIDVPEGYVLSQDYIGFHKADDPYAMIMYMNIPAPIKDISVGFTPENLQAQQMELLDKQSVDLGTDSAYLLHITQASGMLVYEKFILLWGNDSASYMVNGMHLQDSVESVQQIKESVMSVELDQQVSENPEAFLDFKVSAEGTGFKKAKIIGKSIIYSRDGHIPTESEDKTTFIVSKSYASLNITDIERFSKKRLEELPGDFTYTANSFEKISVNSLEGGRVEGFNSSENENIIQTILLNGSSYYIMIGTYLSGDVDAEQDIKMMMQSFQIR